MGLGFIVRRAISRNSPDTWWDILHTVIIDLASIGLGAAVLAMMAVVDPKTTRVMVRHFSKRGNPRSTGGG